MGPSYRRGDWKELALSQVWGLGKLSELHWSSKPSSPKEARDGDDAGLRMSVGEGWEGVRSETEKGWDQTRPGGPQEGAGRLLSSDVR